MTTIIRSSDREAGLSSTAVSAPTAISAPPQSACHELDTLLNGLDLRQKLAQTLMVGVRNIADASAAVNDQHVGGIFITSWTDLSMLTSGALRELQSAQRQIPLAVSVDEEGGRVQRLRSLIGYQDSPRQLAAGVSAQQVQAIAYERGRKMRDYGITVDFAPVVDVTGDADGTVIGDRSFGADPHTVTEYAGAYAQGLREAGLLPVLKHFPGHGRASGDSHHSGVTTPPLEQLLQIDTVPYRTLTAAHPVAVMLGHMQVPGLTGTDPASLSGAAYAFLREGRYGGPAFDGPTFTDDLSSMAAITQLYSVPDAVLKALQAGADTALWISTDQVPAVLDRLESAVNSGELTIARVEDAVRTMAVAKNPALACTR
ncbi:glycoside hydrolase family 3 N-terminal domain-containing protein [Mycobacterium sp. SMC-4]|uniref:glycoside hydrolase family 3 N-terminal domain-containing protein n=1 Tax=Mycobacterium sp. SMC-4 TaxID=2857059 RepID=UPI0021B26D34|nr:glycoside hydrolase family 3 N-terminal domain-containing protein [Mycobacterium sp. SMC-4]